MTTKQERLNLIEAMAREQLLDAVERTLVPATEADLSVVRQRFTAWYEAATGKKSDDGADPARPVAVTDASRGVDHLAWFRTFSHERLSQEVRVLRKLVTGARVRIGLAAAVGISAWLALLLLPRDGVSFVVEMGLAFGAFVYADFVFRRQLSPFVHMRAQAVKALVEMNDGDSGEQSTGVANG